MQTAKNPYLKLDVMGASPIRLRWMLISRASELCTLVESLWKSGETSEANGWLLRIREILGELLGGVRDASNPLGQSVSDLYVFLLQLVTKVEQTQNAEDLAQLKMLLDIEKETWQQVILKESGAAGGRSDSSHTPAPTSTKATPLTSLNVRA